MKKLLIYLPWLVLVGCVYFLIKQIFRIEIPIDTGDGLTHYFIANYALEQPSMYLDHWGKPFFTLLTSSFTWFGYKGIIVFNLLIFILTSIIGFLSLKELKASVLLQAVFPLILIYSYDYSVNILSGLTEVLAGFMIALSGYFLLKKNWLLMAIGISFLPFCRSEGQLIIILGLIVLLYNKQFKIIPFLLSGFLIYALIGWIALGDFLWYFHNDPYPSESSYGKGNWAHFWKLKTTYLGYPGLAILVSALVSIVFAIIKKRFFQLRLDFLFFGFSAFFGIVLVHAFFWAYGLKGSLGLTRVATIGLPILIIACLYLIQQLNFEHKTPKISFVILFSIAAFVCNKTVYRIPQNLGLDRSVIQAAKYIEKNKPSNTHVFYFHPLFAYSVGVNKFRPDDVYKELYFRGNEEDFLALQYGDFVVRDSHFGPVEVRLPLSVLEKNKEMVLVNEFFPPQPGESYHGEKWNVRIYQKIPIEKQQKVVEQENQKIVLEKANFNIRPKDTFVGILEQKMNSNISLLELEFQATNEGGFLVCDINNNQTWTSTPLKQQEKLKIKIPVKQNDFVKLYFWNPNKVENKVEIMDIHLSKKSFHPIIKI